MTSRPSRLSKTLSLDLADGRGDVLGDVLSLGFLRNVLHRQIEARAPWGLDIAEKNRATLYLIARGSARLEMKGRPAILLEAGHVAFLSRGAAHVLRDSPTSRAVAVCDGVATGPSGAQRIGGSGASTSIITAHFERDRATLIDRPTDVVVLSGDDSPSAGTIALVLAELANPGPASVLLLQRLADVLVVQAMRALTKQPLCQAARRPGLVALSDPPIHDALSLMHAQVAHPWTVAALASRVGLSRSGFAARFHELVGEPPLQYLARWRMTRAAELLRDSTEPVSAIATRVGYDSTPSFNKAFKHWQRTTPGAYRRGQRTS